MPSAAYYLGTYHSGGQTSSFETTSTWLMLDQRGIVSIRAIDANGKFLMSFTIKEPMAAPAATPHPTHVATTPSPAVVSAVEPELSDEEVTSNVLERGDPEPTPTLKAPRQRRLLFGATAALGHERIQATGGITDYSASALIAGAVLSASWQSNRDFWYLNGALELHRLNVSERVVSATAQGSGESSSTFLRTFDTAGVFYDLRNGISSQDKRIGFGAGLAYLRLPMLQAAAGANEAHLKQQSAYGPFVGVDIGVPAWKTNRVGVSAELMPATFVHNTRALAMHVQVALSRPIAKRWSGLVTADSQRQFLSRTGDCPAIATCADQMTANSSVFLLSAGVSYQP